MTWVIFPGILHDSDDSRVIGELYEVSEEDFEMICLLEGNGSLYQCESVKAITADSSEEIVAEIFVYLGNVKEEWRIPENDQPWRAEQV